MIQRFLTTLLIVFILTACSGPGYYLQAVSGQWNLLRSRQDIQKLLNSPATSPELVAHLQAADEIKAYAQSVLDLPGRDSYTSYVEVEGDALVWNVVATPEFSLQPKKWCFPVAGCVPYRGFFKYKKAKKSAERLQSRNMDVYISPAAAYSSLGWFEDPLLSTMFSGPDTRLAAFLFHELAHQRLYVKGDGLFNESYASFVEETGVKIWLKSQQRQDDLLRWQELQNARTDFSELVAEIRNRLNSLYLSDASEQTKRKHKAESFASLSHSYERLSTEKWGGNRYYDEWFKQPLNNAKLALYNTYQGSVCAFQELFDSTGGDMKEFHRLAARKARLKSTERADWLRQPCGTIAQAADI